jgi:hypothetical protein
MTVITPPNLQHYCIFPIRDYYKAAFISISKTIKY